MIRTASTILLSLTAFSAVAAPAAAADVHVNIVGKDMPAIRAEVMAAANAVCREELRGSMEGFRMHGACVRAVSQEPIAKARAATEAYAKGRPVTPLDVTRVSAGR